ncbi:MAG TPA: hypothetical protein VJV78_29990 [Polyangiales bacterium]|nr:hypothetical protein [Polyangiales bacterium]
MFAFARFAWRPVIFCSLLSACSAPKREPPRPDVPVEVDAGDPPSMPVEVPDAGLPPAATDAASEVPPAKDAAPNPPPPDAAMPPREMEPAPGIESTPMMDQDDGCGDVAPGTLVEIPVAAQALVADRVRHRLYAAVGSASKLHSDHLVAIDPALGVVSASVPVGPDPTTLAIADDASTLWVGLAGRHEVRKVDLTTAEPTPGTRIPLTDPSASVVAQDMSVLPGEPNAVAISLHYSGVSPSYAGAMILDDGIPRPTPASSVRGLDLLVAGPEGYLFGMNRSTLPSFSVVTVDSSGPTVSDVRSTFVRAPDSPSSPPSELVYDRDGYVYAASGDVIDVRDPAQPRVAGRFGFSGAIAAVPGSDVALMLSVEDAGALRLRLLDTATFAQRTSKRVAASKSFEVIRDVSYLGPHCLGFIHERPGAATSSVYVLHEDLAAGAAPTVDPVPVAHDGVTELPLPAAALAFDAKRGLLYATVPGDAGAYANRLVSIDPSSAKVVQSIELGSNPGALSLSDDAASLWVSVTGSYEIRRIDLGRQPPTLTERRLLPRTSSPDLAMAAASSLLLLPGSSASLALALYFTDGRSPRFAGELVLDGDDPRPKQITSAADGPSLLLPGPSGHLLGVGDHGFYSSVLDAQGISQPQMLGGLRFAYPCGAYDSDGFVYSASGEVLDAHDPGEVSLRGTFPHPGAVLPMPDSATVYMVSVSPEHAASPLTFRTLDTNSLSEVGAMPLGSPELYDPVCELVRTGPRSFAFIVKIGGTNARTALYLVKNAL